MKIKSIMKKPVVSARPSISVKEIVKKMADRKIGGVVVTDKKVPIGIFTMGNLLRALENGADLDRTLIKTIMHTPIMPVGENENFIGVARRIGYNEPGRFIIVDREGRLTGVVTRFDIVKGYVLTSLSYKTSLAAVVFAGLTAASTTPLKKIARMMIDGRQNSVVIIKNKKPIGIVTESLFVKLAALFKDPFKFKAGEKMIRNFFTAKPDDSLRESVLKMIKTDLHNIVVSDETGKFAGVVSLRDIVAFIIQSQL